MSQDHYLDVVLDTIPGVYSVDKLLSYGEVLGIAYINQESDLEEQRSYLSPYEALHIILEGLDCARINPQDFTKIAHVTIKICETYASVMFYEKNGKLALSLRPASTYWLNNQDDLESIDIPRYKKFLLDWCKDFTIINIEEIDSYDAEYS